MDETKLTADLPSLHIEIVHRDDPEARAEMITVHMQAMPSFAAMHDALFSPLFNPFGPANPVLAWTRMMQAAWTPWLSLMAPRASLSGRNERTGPRPLPPQGPDRSDEA
jgi:hypothetical protein